MTESIIKKIIVQVKKALTMLLILPLELVLFLVYKCFCYK